MSEWAIIFDARSGQFRAAQARQMDGAQVFELAGTPQPTMQHMAGHLRVLAREAELRRLKDELVLNPG